uniref:uncharacterized protein LOC122588165 n=1 Tax=Erigeron canadensis TaxID=72917 RepID=UPI001CB95993|nr:uncharacterized protein LOC122588165 [Erigeron canadensis]
MSNFNNQKENDFWNNAVNDFNQSYSNQPPQTPFIPPPNDPRYAQFMAAYYVSLAAAQPPNFYHGGSSSAAQFQQHDQHSFPTPPCNPTPTHESAPTPESVPTPQSIPEAQPKKGRVKSMSKRTKKSKQPKEPAANSSNWTELEMKVLTECWIDATEDPYIGKDQSVDSFWGIIIDKYNARFPSNTRNHNQISGKWRKIRTNVSKFNAIWKGYDGHRCSGENDAQVMEEARSEYFT